MLMCWFKFPREWVNLITVIAPTCFILFAEYVYPYVNDNWHCKKYDKLRGRVREENDVRRSDVILSLMADNADMLIYVSAGMS